MLKVDLKCDWLFLKVRTEVKKEEEKQRVENELFGNLSWRCKMEGNEKNKVEKNRKYFF